jgi:hypothetical protein
MHFSWIIRTTTDDACLALRTWARLYASDYDMWQAQKNFRGRVRRIRAAA